MKSQVIKTSLVNSKIKKKTELIDTLNGLKTDFILWQDDPKKISDIEKKLETISDEEISSKLSSSPIFEKLNNEKMSPLFLRLSKISSSEAKLADIVNNGLDFPNENERNIFIHDYYKNLYCKDPNEPDTLDGCIEEFLGPEILQNDMVLASKISDFERDSLDGEITLAELDKSINECKTKSAGGMDGVSNGF